jgi:ketosteroid isomerase-like protein
MGVSNVSEFDDLVDAYEDPAGSADGRRAAKAAVKTFFAAIAGHDLQLLTSCLSDDTTNEFPFSESGRTEDGAFRVFHGRAEVLESWKTAFAIEGDRLPYTDLDMTMNADGSRVFIEARGRLLRTSGRHYENRYVFRFDVRDGRIVHSKEYFNPIATAYAFQRPVAGRYTIESL